MANLQSIKVQIILTQEGSKANVGQHRPFLNHCLQRATQRTLWLWKLWQEVSVNGANNTSASPSKCFSMPKTVAFMLSVMSQFLCFHREFSFCQTVGNQVRLYIMGLRRRNDATLGRSISLQWMTYENKSCQQHEPQQNEPRHSLQFTWREVKMCSSLKSHTILSFFGINWQDHLLHSKFRILKPPLSLQLLPI